MKRFVKELVKNYETNRKELNPDNVQGVDVEGYSFDDDNPERELECQELDVNPYDYQIYIVYPNDLNYWWEIQKWGLEAYENTIVIHTPYCEFCRTYLGFFYQECYNCMDDPQYDWEHNESVLESMETDIEYSLLFNQLNLNKQTQKNK